MKYPLTFIILTLTLSMYGQSLDREVIGSTGGVFNFSTGSISSTVGETIIATIENNSFSVAQGYQQSINHNVAIRKIQVENLKIWPNPTLSMLHFELPNTVSTFNYEVYDNMGKVVLFGTNAERSLDVSKIAPAAYFIKIKYGSKISIGSFIKF